MSHQQASSIGGITREVLGFEYEVELKLTESEIATPAKRNPDIRFKVLSVELLAVNPHLAINTSPLTFVNLRSELYGLMDVRQAEQKIPMYFM